MSDKAWHISYLSAIIGPCAATTDDGCMAWDDDENGFVMRLLDRDNDGKNLLVVIQPEIDELQLYTVTGYCVANELPYMIKDWEALSAEGQKEAQKTRH